MSQTQPPAPPAAVPRAPSGRAGDTNPGHIRSGVLIWPQFVSWAELVEGARVAEEMGFDDIWTWDHLVPILGDSDGPNFEGVVTLAGFATVTRRARLGLMVAANTFRNPGLLVKMATGLDHLSGGRMVLGLGGGWFEEEHRRFGLDFGTGWPDRLRRLDEAATIIRSLLDGEVVSLIGNHYVVSDLANAPQPVQRRLPLLIGGGGERRTLATVARFADLWNLGEDVETTRRKVGVLGEWCERHGRDPATIERTFGVGAMVLCRNRPDGERILAGLRDRNRGWTDAVEILHPGELTDRLGTIVELGFTTFYLDGPAPYDLDTWHQFASDVIPALQTSPA